ncbi:acetate kinase, partial [Francisella tularensis subsp. holarctica]|nr:acetate kinase [Francisella tularensis subsp. holarctica]
NLAIEILSHRVAKFVASYIIYFNKLDALVFTGGIGENAANILKNIISKLANLGFMIDHQKYSNSETFINSKNSHNIMVI